MSSLAALLNRRPYHNRLESHWARGVVRDLSDALFDLDAMGLRGFCCPADEYEPEALLAVCKVLGLRGHDELWDLSLFDAAERPPPTRDVVERALKDAFSELFHTGAGDEALASADLFPVVHIGLAALRAAAEKEGVALS
jgi:hypothetical protein